jgi:hypothetical protein
MNIRRFESELQLNSGLIIPASAKPGYALVTDWVGNAAWQDKTPPNIQPGFLGLVGPGSTISATLPGTTSLTPTFTGYPGADFAYWNNAINGASGLIKGVLPASLPALPLTVSPVSGNFLYVALVAQAPIVHEGDVTPSLSWLHTSATSRSTANLAAADQFTFQPAETFGTLSYSLILWDGIVWNNGGNYSFVAGTPASGSPIPATGRDRRPWARGAHGDVFYAPGSNYTTTNTAALAAVDATNLALRLEISAPALEFEFKTAGYVRGGQDVVMAMMLDGVTSIAGDNFFVASNATELPWYLRVFYSNLAAGSHRFEPGWFVTGSTATLVNRWWSVRVREILQPATNNGTA